MEVLLAELADRFAAVDANLRRSVLPPRRSVEVVLTDLDVRYHALMRSGELSEITPGPLARPDVRLSADSDDLLAMARGQLPLSTAYADGRLKVEASMMDLLRLRVLL